MQVHLVDGTYELFRQFLAPRPGHLDADGVEVGATRAVVCVGAHDARRRRDPPRRRHRPRDRVVPQRPLGRRTRTARASIPMLIGAVPAARGRARGARRRRVADGRVRGRRRARERGARSRPPNARGRAGDHLHARQGPRPVRRRQGRAARPAHATMLLDADGVREKFGVLPESIPDWLALVGDTADGFPGPARLRREDRGRAARALRPHRGDPRRPAAWDVPGVRGADDSRRRWPPGRAVADAVQGARDAAHRRAVGAVDDWEWTRSDRASSAIGATRFGSPRLARAGGQARGEERSGSVDDRRRCSIEPSGPGSRSSR